MSMAHRFLPVETAFVASRGQKRPKRDTPDHLAFVRTLPCIVDNDRCFGDTQAHHVRYTDLRFGKRDLGRERPDDCWTVPVCLYHHDIVHAAGEPKFWRKIGVNPLIVALALFVNSGDVDIAMEVLRRCK